MSKRGDILRAQRNAGGRWPRGAPGLPRSTANTKGAAFNGAVYGKAAKAVRTAPPRPRGLPPLDLGALMGAVPPRPYQMRPQGEKWAPPVSAPEAAKVSEERRRREARGAQMRTKRLEWLQDNDSNWGRRMKGDPKV